MAEDSIKQEKIEILKEGVEEWTEEARMRQQDGLTLANTGAIYRANEVLQKLYDEGNLDEDTFGILARTHKDLWIKNKGNAEGDLHLLKSYMIYSEGFEKTGGYYTAINAATMGLFLSKEEDRRAEEFRYKARNLQQEASKYHEKSDQFLEYKELIKQTEMHEEKSEDLKKKVKNFANEAFDISKNEMKEKNTYWSIVTMGEASIILGGIEEASGKSDEAKKYYKQSEEYYNQGVEYYNQGVEVEIEKRNWKDLNSSKKQLKLLSKIIPEAKNVLEECFPAPKVVVFAGHMIDKEGRKPKRFPPEIEKQVKQKIREIIEEWRYVEGFASAACGSDILFLEVLREMGKDINVVLPYNKDVFCNDSVAVADEKWEVRYYKIINDLIKKEKPGKPGKLYIASNKKDDGSVSYENANMLLLGFATLRAREIGAEIKTLAVWDGKPGDGPGGTSSIVGRWEDIGIEPEIINPTDYIEKKMSTVELGKLNPKSISIQGNNKHKANENIDKKADVPPNQWKESNPRIKAICYYKIVNMTELTGSQVQVQDFDDEVEPKIIDIKIEYNSKKLFDDNNSGGEFFEFNGSPEFKTDEIRDWKEFVNDLKNADNSAIRHLKKCFSDTVRDMIDDLDLNRTISQDEKEAIIDDLNNIIKENDFSKQEDFNNIKISSESIKMLEIDLKDPNSQEIRLLNRLLIESIFKYNIMRNPYASVRDAGNFAIACSEVINDAKKTISNMPESLGIKIILHVCPVSKCYTDNQYCPINLQKSYYDKVLGYDIHTCKRIAFTPMFSVFPAFPIYFYWTLLTDNLVSFKDHHGSKFPDISKIPSHQVYATREFAAIASAFGIDDFTCELTKIVSSSMDDKATIPIYALR